MEIVTSASASRNAPIGHLRVASVAGSADGHSTGRTPAPPRRHRPRRQPRGPLVLAARAGGSRRAGLPGGGERLHRGHARAPGRPPRGALRGDEGPDQGDRHVGARPAGALVVLHPHRGGRELRHPLPPARPGPGRAAPGRRAGRGGADPPRRERAGRGLGLLRRGQRRRQPRPSLAGLLDRPHRGREVRAALHPARRRHARWRPRSCPRPGTGWPGPPRPTTSSTSAWTRRCAPSSCGATAWAATRGPTSSSSRSPTAASPSASARAATRPSCSSGCTAPTPPSGRPSRPTGPRRRRGSSWPVARASSTASTISAGAPGQGWFVALTNEDALDFRVLAAPDDRPRRAPGARWCRIGPACASRTWTRSPRCSVLSERSEAQTEVRVLPLAAMGDPFAGNLLDRGLDRALHRQPVLHLARGQPRARSALAAHRAHLHGDPGQRAPDRAGRAPGDAAQAGARPGRLRPGPLRQPARVGARPRRHPRPHLAGAPARPGPARPDRPLRLRRLRDLHRPGLLPPPPLAARPGRRLRHRPRARRR